ncbi:MarR family transcriptional regulator [Streptomyces sp. NPDC058623]|uniref:MarR family transcriptional regulator n=1 Tax=Streptomyces sp. NPDC058623 TaxID=3346563 RepID=UPI00365377FC
MPVPAPLPRPYRSDRDAARSVSDIVELLDVTREAARQRASAGPASTSQLRLTYVAGRQPRIRMRALAQLLDAVAPSITRLCDRLEVSGFLERHPSPGNSHELTRS